MSDTKNAGSSDSVNAQVLDYDIPMPQKDAGYREKEEEQEISSVEVKIDDARKQISEEEEKNESEKPLMEESVKIDILKPGYEGEDTPTLPLPEKKKQSKGEREILEKRQKEKLPIYLFPFSRIKESWSDSTNVFGFLGAATCILFQTVGWFTCVGGIPFLSLVMLIIGSIYVDDCPSERNIPVYLIVSGAIGTLQHFITIWTKYVPKESQGRLKVYRSYCRLINGVFHLFLIIWFIIGAVWVYGSEVDFEYPYKDEYCNKTLYYFAFWIFNLSFILIGMLVVLSVCFLLCVVGTPKDKTDLQ